MIPFLLSLMVVTAPDTYVVRNGLGGSVGYHATKIMTLKSRRTVVEIKGLLCWSACTLYLGAGNVCVHARTVFGFHGPSMFGIPLGKANFDYWSDVIGSFYKPSLKSWYTETARHARAAIPVTGETLIGLGYKEC